MSLSPAHKDERGLHDPGSGGLIHKSHRGCNLSVSPSEPTSSPAYPSLQAVSALDETMPSSCHVLTMKAYHQMFRPEGLHLPSHIQGSRELQPAAICQEFFPQVQIVEMTLTEPFLLSRVLLPLPHQVEDTQLVSGINSTPGPNN